MEKINNFTEYVDKINNLADSLLKDVVRDDILLFRGHADASYTLLPSIARKTEKMEQSLLTFEKDMISKAIGKNPEVFYEDTYAINLLVKLQHFGIPTRLLDVTYNALVALFFACKDEPDKDGEVLVFKVTSELGDYIRYFNDEYVNIIANMYKANNNVYPCSVFSFLNKLGIDTMGPDDSSGEIVDKIESIVLSIKEPLIVSPVELSERQKRQQGAFLLFPDRIDKKSGCEGGYAIFNEIVELNKENEIIVENIIIPKENKEDIIKYLNNFGITEEFLFPDSTDILCKTIKENSLLRISKK